jgi:predicted nucleic-acid-binding Zn-ribbon protein
MRLEFDKAVNVVEVKKCPKCGGDMGIGYLTNAPHWTRGTSLFVLRRGKRIFGYRCVDCSYVEFYVESTKEKAQVVSRHEGSRMVCK